MSVQYLKWGILTVPAVAGLAIGVQQTTSSSENIDFVSASIAPPSELMNHKLYLA